MTFHARFSLQETTRIKVYAPPREKGGQWPIVPGVRAKLSPVTGEPFGSATPGGNLEMVIANPDVCKELLDAEIGQEYDILFSRVAPSPAIDSTSITPL